MREISSFLQAVVNHISLTKNWIAAGSDGMQKKKQTKNMHILTQMYSL